MRVTKYTAKSVKASEKTHLEIGRCALSRDWTITTYLIGFPENDVVAPPDFER